MNCIRNKFIFFRFQQEGDPHIGHLIFMLNFQVQVTHGTIVMLSIDMIPEPGSMQVQVAQWTLVMLKFDMIPNACPDCGRTHNLIWFLMHASFQCTWTASHPCGTSQCSKAATTTTLTITASRPVREHIFPPRPPVLGSPRPLHVPTGHREHLPSTLMKF